MLGKIIRGVAGFYYVNVEGGGVYECRAKGIFRNRGIKPLPGDDVEIAVLDGAAMTGNIEEIRERRTCLVRPAVANADQVVIVFALSWPEPNLNLLDRFLVLMQRQHMKTLICFNKKDQISERAQGEFARIYQGSGCDVLMVSAKEGDGLDGLAACLRGRTSVLAGPSGVGKSTILNLLYPGANMQTGKISGKNQRGKHTTRHSELFYMGGGTYLFDTPGFSSLELGGIGKEELKDCYPEFFAYEGKCRYLGCLHDKEPECAVKDAVAAGEVCGERYGSYLLLLEEQKNRKRY